MNGNPEYDYILSRASLQKRDVTVDTSICRNHKTRLGKYYERIFITNKNKCASPLHQGKQTGKRKELPQMTLFMSQELLRKKCYFSLPCSEYICKICKANINKIIADQPEPESEEQSTEHELSFLNMSLEDNAGDAGSSSRGSQSQSLSSQSQSLSGSQPKLSKSEEDKSRNHKFRILNTYLRDSGYQEADRHLASDYDTITPRYKGSFQRAMANSIAATAKVNIIYHTILMCPSKVGYL